MWPLFSSAVLPDASAENPAEMNCRKQAFQTLPERISPLTIAYRRLKAVLSAHGIPKNIPFVLSDTTCALSDPLCLPWLARSLTEQTNSLTPQPVSDLFKVQPREIMQGLLLKAAKAFSVTADLKSPMEFSPFEGEGTPPIETLVDRMVATIASADSMVKEAFSDISSNKMARLLNLFPGALNHFFNDDNFSDRDANLLTASAKKVHMEDLLHGGSILLNLFSDDFLHTIRLACSSAQTVALDHKKYPGLEGRFLLIRETPVGLVLIGDEGPNVYGANASLIIDLGGDDLYMNNAGAPIYKIQEKAVSGIPCATGVVIDFEGNDRYINPGFAGVASGFFGLGVVLDMSGNDVYDGGQLSLGASFFGMGCLMDMSGNDTYMCSEGGQGCAFFGAACLFDGKGNDLYSGAKYVQGVGGPMGFGQLLDAAGEDHYRAGWKHGSSYGTKGIYQACSQGIGWGFRKHAAGGMGILLDSAGNDIYEAGNFAQGTGYYFGLGVLRDNGGNDIYRGSRYCQGAAAHQAAGALIDLAGNDVYSGKIAANQGAAWDLSVACLVDYAGDDCYEGADLSLGAGAQNGVGLFLDGEGNDRYESGAGSLGFSGDLSYGGGRNIGNMGIFLDLGGGTDFFALKTRTNDAFYAKDNLWIFLDE